jgi:hypothetical protein
MKTMLNLSVVLFAKNGMNPCANEQKSDRKRDEAE